MPFDTDRFDAYVRGELPDGERARLEAELTADREDGGEMSREWDAHLEAADATARAAVRRRVGAAAARYRDAESVHREPTATAQVRPLWQRSWAAAAAVLLLLTAGGYFLLADGGTPREPQALASTYFEPAIGLPTLLGPAEDIRFEDGMVDYKLGDYEAALARWRPLAGEDFDQDTLAYYVGVAELAAGRPERALEELRQVTSPELQEGRQWYEAMGLLMLGRVNDARPLLRDLSAGSHKYSTQAAEVLEGL